MKAIGGYLFTTLFLALAGITCLQVGLLDRDMAHAQQSVLTLKYDEPDQTFATAERYFEWGSRLPGFGNGPVNDIRARRAALHYWQGEYSAILSQPDPVSNVQADNVGLQLVVANAVYRDGRKRAKDRQTTLQILSDSIQAYSTVLKNATREDDAAYNYEYLVRLRNEFLDGRANTLPPGELVDLNGTPGRSPAGEDLSKFKIYIPLAPQERNAAGAAKAGPIKRKG